MNINLKHIPFSRFGSYLSISYLPKNDYRSEGIYLRTIRGGDDDVGALFKLDVTKNGHCIPFNAIATETCLCLQAEEGVVRLIYSEAHCLRIYGEQVGLRLSLVTNAYDNAFYYQARSWQVNVFSQSIRFMLTPFIGELDVSAPWDINGSSYVIADFHPSEDNGTVEGIIEEFLTIYEQKNDYPTFETALDHVNEEYKKWLENTLPVPAEYEAGRQLAAYITWSCVVKQEGYLPRPAMYMSKNWMTNIWSWDHCFNAMALVKKNPELAWDQFMIFFDVQAKNGLLPDFMNDQFAYWNCSKPPIHGWTLAWMLKHSNELSKENLAEIYQPLKQWTSWFFKERDVDNNGFPEYQHGNDSGWDNSTLFHQGIPIESPDLCAFLILQMETLAEIANRLHFQMDHEEWKKKADQLLTDMLAYFWDGEQFVAKLAGENVRSGDSLLLFMPIILAKRLPKQIRLRLIEGLKDENRFLTEHGLATESLQSPYYLEDGYWRGPIWAPSTMLLIDGLMESGEEAFARDLAHKFCNMALKHGMAENFNAVSGEGLRDRAFTWTSSVFLILAHEYVNKETEKPSL